MLLRKPTVFFFIFLSYTKFRNCDTKKENDIEKTIFAVYNRYVGTVIILKVLIRRILCQNIQCTMNI